MCAMSSPRADLHDGIVKYIYFISIIQTAFIPLINLILRLFPSKRLTPRLDKEETNVFPNGHPL
jgi:hypothetical protein